MRQRGIVALLAAAIAAGTAGKVPATAACPSLGSDLWAHARRGPADRLVTVGAESVLVCYYGGDSRDARDAVLLDVRPPEPGDLPREEPALGNRVALNLHRVGRLSPQVRGPGCRVEDRDWYVAVVRYADHTEVALVDHVCGIAENGTLSTRLTGRFVTPLLAEALA